MFTTPQTRKFLYNGSIKRPFDTIVIDSMVIGIPPAGISSVSLGNTGRGKFFAANSTFHTNMVMLLSFHTEWQTGGNQSLKITNECKHAKKDSICLHCPSLYLYETKRTHSWACFYIYVSLLSCKYPPRILFSRHLSADMHDGRKTSCKVRNHQLDRIHDFHLLTFYDNFTIA